MPETKLVKICSEAGKKVIFTTLTEDVSAILEKDGIQWFEALKNPVALSPTSFHELEMLISPDPG